MKPENLILENRDQVLLLRLNRPAEGNALNNALRDELEAVLEKAREDNAVKAVVLAGGSKVFSSGYDLKEVIDTRLGAFSHRVTEYNLALYTFPKPLIVAVTGFCMAGGFDLALAGDIIVAGEKKTFFGHPEMRFAPPFVAPLARKVGVDRARALILTGGMISSKEAMALGIVNQLVPNDEVENTALKLAQGMAKWRVQNTTLVKQVCSGLEFGDMRAAIIKELDLVKGVLADDSVLPEIEEYYAGLNK